MSAYMTYASMTGAGVHHTARARTTPQKEAPIAGKFEALLTVDETRNLAVAWRDRGDTAARDRLVRCNLRLVISLASKYARSGGTWLFKDLVQEGTIGLMRGVEKYDPARGVKISTYVAWWIKAWMLRYIMANVRQVKLCRTAAHRRVFFNLRKSQARLTAAGQDPTPAAIAADLKVSEDDVIEIALRVSRADASLDDPWRNDNLYSPNNRIALLAPATATDPSASPESVVAADEHACIVRDRVQAFGATLTGRELELFRDRLTAEDPATLRAIGERWGVSRERARQLEARLLDRMRIELADLDPTSTQS